MSNESDDGGACPVCDRGFGDRETLERHAEAEHDVLRDFLAA